MSEKKKLENEKVKVQETENKQRTVSMDNSPELSTENNSKNDDEDLLYTHKPETQNGSIHWNSNFCRKPGH